jgi:hypothetical protein
VPFCGDPHHTAATPSSCHRVGVQPSGCATHLRSSRIGGTLPPCWSPAFRLRNNTFALPVSRWSPAFRLRNNTFALPVSGASCHRAGVKPSGAFRLPNHITLLLFFSCFSRPSPPAIIFSRISLAQRLFVDHFCAKTRTSSPSPTFSGSRSSGLVTANPGRFITCV